MTKKLQNLLSKMQSVLRKGTVETLCTLLLILFVVASCKETTPPDENDGKEINSNIILQGTKWKLVGLVNVCTQNIKTLKPTHCEECYRIEFETDYDFIAYSVNKEIKQNLLYQDYPPNNFLLFCEKYFADGKEYCDSEDFRKGIIYMKEYEVNERELKLFRNGNATYLLFKPIINQE